MQQPGEELIADFKVEWDLYQSSRNKTDGYHHRSLADVKGLCRTVVMDCWKKAGEPGKANRRSCRLEIVVYRGTAMDLNNLPDGFKWVQDTLFRRSLNGEGITDDDNPKWLPQSHWITQEIAPEWSRDQQGPWFQLRVYAFGPEHPARKQAASAGKLTGDAALKALEKELQRGPKKFRAPSWRTRRSFGRRSR